jgi:hypothetical protein
MCANMFSNLSVVLDLRLSAGYSEIGFWTPDLLIECHVSPAGGFGSIHVSLPHVRIWILKPFFLNHPSMGPEGRRPWAT